MRQSASGAADATHPGGILPGLLYMYRADVFEDTPLLRAIAVFPNT
jgi:hypothetical protein